MSENDNSPEGGEARGLRSSSSASVTFEVPVHPAAIVSESPPPAAVGHIPFEIGELISGVYEVGEGLGEGGMGVVFEAHDRWLNRRVAIKVSHPGVSAKYLRFEAQAMAAVQHRSTVAAYAFGNHRGIDFLVMERLYGVTLRAHSARLQASGQRLTQLEVLTIMTDVCDALAAMHRAQIAHRDVKPSNILLAPNDRVVVMDFGLFVKESYEGADSVAGSPPYMAPEVIAGQQRKGEWHLADLYSLGVVAFELLSGRRPYMGHDLRTLVDQQSSPAESLAKHRHDVHPKLVQLIDELVNPAPERRSQSAELLLLQLRMVRSEISREVSVATDAERRPFTVLIVDDDPVMLAVLLASVQECVPAARVLTAADGAQAVELVRRSLPDVLLLDLHMPTMNGIQVCMHLRATHLTERTTIVSVSGRAQLGELLLLQQLGIVHFVGKDAALRERLSTILVPLERASRI
ncbi:MAG: serine/threonine-protein kinase [Deltaproteobacteria bacterium]|nr:serine/threonine-protein kinase [Deltaproteobacteria bacterium]